MKYIIIGTAGHVDHGKTALIRALTGADTDRLKEEKERGISIDLGFASLTVCDGIQAGIVDVPGHERFLKNMLAGTGGIDLVMLTIAADEGVMPQTREHLAMLQLYGVRYGLVVVTKSDKVDAEWLNMLDEEIRDFLSGTFLEGAPVCHVSSVTGAGLEDLRMKLAELAQKLTARDTKAPFRLWIDRTFTVKGHGVVITGTALSGTAGVGDTLALYPAGKQVRIRGLESHGSKLEKVFAGQRTAMNITGTDLAELGRGMVVSDASRGQVSRYWDVTVDWRQQVEAGCRIRLHMGTGEFIGRIYKPKRSPEGQYRLTLEQPLAAGAGDRGILRLYSPQYLLGGVVLLGAVGEGAKEYPDKRGIGQAASQGDGKAIAAAILSWQHVPLMIEDIKRMAGYIPDHAIETGVKNLVAAGNIVSLDRFLIEKVKLADLESRIQCLLQQYHQANTNRLGMPKAELRQKLNLSEKVFEVLISYIINKNTIYLNGAELALPSHAAKHRGWQDNIAEEAQKLLDGCGLIDVDVSYICQKTNMPQVKAQKYLEALNKEGIVLRIGGIHVYRKTIQYIVEVIQRHFQANPTLTVAELRDLLNTSRKFALPVMEYLDMHKYTTRDGDLRRAGPKIKDLSEKTIF